MTKKLSVLSQYFTVT